MNFVNCNLVLLPMQPLVDVLHNLLPQVPTQNPLLIVLDGLDLMNMQDVSWLPKTLPSHIRLIVTVSNGTNFQHILDVSKTSVYNSFTSN
jgi:hypothetical protein